MRRDLLPVPSGSGRHHNRLSNLDRFPQGELESSLDHNLAWIQEVLSHSSDLIIKETQLTLANGDKLGAAVLYIDGLADTIIVHQFIMLPLLERRIESSSIHEVALALSATGVSIVREKPQLLVALLSSSTLLLVDGSADALTISTEGWEHRKVGIPVKETILRGPHEAFNEVLRVNTGLIRRRVKDPNMAIDMIRIGTRSLTDVAIVYITDIANPAIVREVKRRLQEIQVDAIRDGGELEEYLEDNPWSPFPQIEHSERIDKITAAVLDGKVAVIVDGSPFALSMPATFEGFLYSPEDYYGKFLSATFIRWIRGIALFMALFLPSIYIALTTFHQEMLPTELMLSSAANRSGVPFPAFIEALIMEISIELLREASLRLPGTLGQTIGIVGALVIGQAAVEAGIVGPVLTIVVSFTAIGSFVIPSYNTSITIRLLRFPIMLLSATLGIFGIVFGGAAILIHLINLRSFGIGYMEAFRPTRWEHLDDSLVLKKPSFLLQYRQRFIQQRNLRRRG